MNNDLSPGFSDPVANAQSCFRAVLDAMASPGAVRRVGGVKAPSPLCDAIAGVLLTLTDHETPLWVDREAVAASAWIAFHTGAPIVAQQDATFVVALSLPDFNGLSAGTDEMPESSATVILQVSSIISGRKFLLDGPGLREPRVVAIDSLPADFVAMWQQNHALYPRGIDLILCAGDCVTALPRSVRVQEA